VTLANEARGNPAKIAGLLRYLLPADERHGDKAGAAMVFVAEALDALHSLKSS
jgi:hypothetical protein